MEELHLGEETVGQATFRVVRRRSRGDSGYADGRLHERFCEEEEAEVCLGIYYVGVAENPVVIV